VVWHGISKKCGTCGSVTRIIGYCRTCSQARKVVNLPDLRSIHNNAVELIKKNPMARAIEAAQKQKQQEQQQQQQQQPKPGREGRPGYPGNRQITADDFHDLVDRVTEIEYRVRSIWNREENSENIINRGDTQRLSPRLSEKAGSGYQPTGPWESADFLSPSRLNRRRRIRERPLTREQLADEEERQFQPWLSSNREEAAKMHYHQIGMDLYAQIETKQTLRSNEDRVLNLSSTNEAQQKEGENKTKIPEDDLKILEGIVRDFENKRCSPHDILIGSSSEEKSYTY
jgi:Fe-S cluster biosynthesis and repair protein YggX